MVDFGCGKGRLNFYIHYFFHATVVGIEMNEIFYQEAIENLNRYLEKSQNIGRTASFSLLSGGRVSDSPCRQSVLFF